MPASYSLDLRIWIAHDFNDNGNADQALEKIRVLEEGSCKPGTLYLSTSDQTACMTLKTPTG